MTMQSNDGQFRLLSVGPGTEIGCWDSGRGDTILLAHAGVFSDWFLPLSRELPRERFRVVRTRRVGYRGTSRPIGHLSLADHARHAACLLDVLGAGPVHWVGHSSGSLIGLELAQMRPDLVASLTLLEPAPAGDLLRPEDEPLLAATMRPIQQAFMSGDTDAAFDRFMAAICGPASESVLTARLGPEALDTARAESAYFFADELPAVREWVFGADQAARVTVPALVVMGADSIQLTPLMQPSVERLAALLPNARVQTLPGCTHLMPLQQPAALSRLVTEFASGIPVAS
jgi:pimeloyl-ACP methyl ester carboxylesterase